MLERMKLPLDIFCIKSFSRFRSEEAFNVSACCEVINQRTLWVLLSIAFPLSISHISSLYTILNRNDRTVVWGTCCVKKGWLLIWSHLKCFSKSTLVLKLIENFFFIFLHLTILHCSLLSVCLTIKKREWNEKCQKQLNWKLLPYPRDGILLSLKDKTTIPAKLIWSGELSKFCHVSTGG